MQIAERSAVKNVDVFLSLRLFLERIYPICTVITNLIMYIDIMVSGDLPGLSDSARKYMEYADRVMRIYAALGIDYLERALIVVITNDPGPWGVGALSDYIGYNRTTVYRRLLLREGQGICRRVGGKWTSTEFGRAGSIKLINEVGGVVFGVQERLSDEVIDLCASVNPKAKPDEARLITYVGSTF